MHLLEWEPARSLIGPQPVTQFARRPSSPAHRCVRLCVCVCGRVGSRTQGTLKGFDQTINLILDESHERVFSSSQGVEQVVLGLYIVRGDNV